MTQAGLERILERIGESFAYKFLADFFNLLLMSGHFFGAGLQFSTLKWGGVFGSG